MASINGCSNHCAKLNMSAEKNGITYKLATPSNTKGTTNKPIHGIAIKLTSGEIRENLPKMIIKIGVKLINNFHRVSIALPIFNN